jgi:hypothetical protein
VLSELYAAIRSINSDRDNKGFRVESKNVTCNQTAILEVDFNKVIK